MNNKPITAKMPAIFKGSNGVESPVVVELRVTGENATDDDAELTISSTVPGSVFSLQIKGIDFERAVAEAEDQADAVMEEVTVEDLVSRENRA